ncbi:DUF4011 domain-containing protein [Mycoplasma sp. Pen4]|uniref:AAA domain-containing protein n=1 Tax=Mycoplasma sp. Pen4 TaxID=640330 RepID=UPI0016540E9D|nr:AAA domain-containing protein [Mycoplasma sp. Pen4]QNM93489.1 DUF4011 domain-containing protein [Mycoplasma sp. Pen4]
MFEKILNKLLDTSLKNNLINLKSEKYLNIYDIVTKDESFSYDLKEYKAKNKIDHNTIFTSKIPQKDFAKLIDKFSKSNRLSLEDTGVNILNISFGILEWKDRENNEINSPIFLLPVHFEDDRYDHTLLHVDFNNIEINQSLFYKLKNEWNIDATSYATELLNDVKNLDNLKIALDVLLKHLTKINKTKLELNIKNNWYLGIFTFSRISMYNDLIKNKNKLTKSPFYSQIIGKQINNFDFDLPTNDEINNIDYFNYFHCLESDSTQEKAIQAAIKGNSFVLQGPPGTGKSQTISNIISELISSGKKVLFVAEKNAAVDVVYNTLKSKELDKFLLRLHSTEINYSNFSSNILHDYEIAKNLRFINEVEKTQISQSIKNYTDKIEKYKNILVNNNDQSITLFDLVNMYLEITDFNQGFNNFHFKRVYNNTEFIEITDLIKKYQNLKNYPNKIQENNWHKYNYSSDKQFSDVFTSISQLKTAIAQMNYLLGNNDLILDKNNDLFSEITKVENVLILLNETEWLKKNEFSFINELSYLKQVEKNYNKIKSIYKNNDVTYHQNQSNIKTLSNFIKNAPGKFKRLFNKKFKHQLKSLKGFEISQYFKLDSYKKVKKTLKKLKKVNSYFENCQPILDKLTFSFDLDKITIISNLVSNLKHLSEKFNNSEFIYAINYTKDTAPISNNSLHESINLLNLINENLEFLKNNFNYDFAHKNYYEVLAFIDDLIANEKNGFVLLNKTITYNKLSEYQLTEFINALETKGYKDKFVNTFKSSYLNWQITNILKENNLNQDLSSLNEIHKHFQTDLRKLITLSITNALDACAQSLPNFKGDENGILVLRAEAAKSRKHKSIKQIISEAGNVILGIKKCWMMSPLSVSTYLSDLEQDFDVLIIDEASQIKTENALTSILRAKQYIICGDSEQLPPTNFFEEQIFDDENEEEATIYDIDAYDSVLNSAASFMKNINLEWHYRSKYESLIQPSNINVYNNNLISFPESRLNDDYSGLHLVYSKGYYEDGKNDIDVDTVLKKLKQIQKKFGTSKTVGVITMNIKMANYLDTKLRQFVANQNSMKEFVSHDSPTKFFIKNIENVQGDERDIIILVVGFGPNPTTKKVSMNFGAINQKNGYKRINVAMSRAKETLFVVSSLKHNDINIKSNSSKGLYFMQNLLYLAENNKSDKQKLHDVNLFTSNIQKEVYNYLISKNYSPIANVGNSNLKINLALISENLNQDSIGIEIDGNTFIESPILRDSDYSKNEVLKNRGWKIFRIWTTEWIKNKQIVLDNLMNFLKNNNIESNMLNNTVVIEKDLSNNNETNFEDEFDFLVDISRIKSHRAYNEKFEILADELNVIDKKEFQKLVEFILNKPFPSAHENIEKTNRFELENNFYIKKDQENSKITFKKSPLGFKRDYNNLHIKEWIDLCSKSQRLNLFNNDEELAREALKMLGYKQIMSTSIKNVIEIIKSIKNA